MCDVCQKKAQSSARLAAYFHEKAGETRLRTYADIMVQAARSLEELSVYFGSACRCDDDRYRDPIPAGGSATPLTDRLVRECGVMEMIFH